MGSDPNTYSPDPPERNVSPALALTLGEMLARQWQIRAVCHRCGALVWCEPRVLAASAGADVFFWGRTGRCRMMMDLRRCSGRVSFQARPVRSEVWHSLDAPAFTARHLWATRRRKAG